MFGKVLNTALPWWIYTTNFSNIFRIAISPNFSGRLFVQVTREIYFWRQPISTTVCTWVTSCTKKGSFPLRISSLNVAITEEIFNGKFIFWCSVIVVNLRWLSVSLQIHWLVSMMKKITWNRLNTIVKCKNNSGPQLWRSSLLRLFAGSMCEFTEM